jgi:hypothetical protein
VAQGLFVGVHQLHETMAHLVPEAGWFDAVNHHGQIGMLGRFDQDAPLAILNLFELTLLLTPGKGILDEVADGGQHAADEIGVGRGIGVTGDMPK